MNVYDEIKSWLEYIKTHKDKTNKAEYLIRILETVLADREKLIKENKKIEEARNWYFEHTVNKAVTPEMLHKILRQDYIPKSVIKEKIEELENENYQISQESEIAFDSGIMKNNFKIQVLKELLKGSE